MERKQEEWETHCLLQEVLSRWVLYSIQTHKAGDESGRIHGSTGEAPLNFTNERRFPGARAAYKFNEHG